MQVRILDKAPFVRTRFANVASEVAKNGGYLYNAIGEPALQLYLGFGGTPQGRDAIFVNPFWASGSDPIELLPASQDAVAVALSPEAERLGARATVEFYQRSPRIKVNFTSSPVGPMKVGSATVGFSGVWPLKGSYFCSDVQIQCAPIRKELEPFGVIVLRQTALRVVQSLVGEALDRGVWRIDSVGKLGMDFTKDNLAADLCELLFDDVGKRSVALKANPSLPTSMTNTYENSQDGMFARAVTLAI
jgi:hypothetical protein